MANTQSSNNETGSKVISSNSEDPTEQALRIGWISPTHVFVSHSGESLCGQSGTRESMSPSKTRKYTSPISKPIGLLRNKDQIVQFANGICKNCLQEFFEQYHELNQCILTVYEEYIRKYDGNRTLGFCYKCYHPVDISKCEKAKFRGDEPIYICELCCMENFEGLLSNLNTERDSSLANIRTYLQEEIEERRRTT